MNFKKKLETVLSYIYGTGIALVVLIGALSVLGYIAAIIAGGSTAEAICTFIYKQLYPVLIYASSVFVLIGLVKMYISGQHALTSAKKKTADKQTAK